MNLQSSGDGQNLDPLLDTMANVVGILIVVLTVAQMLVGQAVERISEQEAMETERQDATSGERLEDLEVRWQRTAPLLWETRREIDRLREQLEESAPREAAAASDVDLAAQNAAVAASSLRAADLKDQLTAGRDKLAALRVQLRDETAENELAIARVRLPDPRPAPPAAQPQTFVVRFGRIVPLALPTLEQSLFRALSQLGVMDSQAPSMADVSRITRHFDTHSVGDGDFRWSLFDRGRNGLIARLTWQDPQRGELHGELASRESRYQRELRGLSPNRAYLHFHVWNDSFRTYLEARRIAEELGFSAGWSAYPEKAELEANLSRRNYDDPLPID